MADTSTKVYTAPLAIIEINNQEVGKIKNFRASESYQRANVRGLSRLTDEEVPIVAISCTFTASYYTINLTKLGSIDNPFLKRKDGISLQAFLDTLLLGETGISIRLYKKTGTPDASTGLVTTTSKQLVGTIREAFLDSTNFDLSEGQISGSDLSGRYLDPMIV